MTHKGLRWQYSQPRWEVTLFDAGSQPNLWGIALPHRFLYITFFRVDDNVETICAY